MASNRRHWHECVTPRLTTQGLGDLCGQMQRGSWPARQRSSASPSGCTRPPSGRTPTPSPRTTPPPRALPSRGEAPGGNLVPRLESSPIGLFQDANHQALVSGLYQVSHSNGALKDGSTLCTEVPKPPPAPAIPTTPPTGSSAVLACQKRRGGLPPAHLPISAVSLSSEGGIQNLAAHSCMAWQCKTDHWHALQQISSCPLVSRFAVDSDSRTFSKGLGPVAH